MWYSLNAIYDAVISLWFVPSCLGLYSRVGPCQYHRTLTITGILLSGFAMRYRHFNT